MTKQQEEAPKHEDPVFSVEDVYRRFPAIEEAIKRLSRIPRPLPPKKEKADKKKANKTAADDNATEAEGVDKEESKDDFRRVPTEENIKRIGREKINYENLFSGVLYLYPTNNLITVYSTVQSANYQGYFDTSLWLP